MNSIPARAFMSLALALTSASAFAAGHPGD